MSWINILTGISEGRFHNLSVRASNGVMTDILTLLGAVGGITNLTVAGGGISVSGTGVTRTLTVDLSSYLTNVQVNSAITAALATYITQTALNTALTPYFTGTQIALILTAYDSRIAAATATTAALAPYL